MSAATMNLELDREFHSIDFNKNNLITEAEFESFLLQQDTDRDGCISFIEFVKQRSASSLKFTWALFNHFDHDHNGCLEHDDQLEEFNEIDTNPKDGNGSLQEFESYYDKLIIEMEENGILPNK